MIAVTPVSYCYSFVASSQSSYIKYSFSIFYCSIILYSINFDGHYSCCIFRNCYNNMLIVSNKDILCRNAYWSLLFRNADFRINCFRRMLIITGIGHFNIMVSGRHIIEVDYGNPIDDISSECLVSYLNSNVSGCIV